MKQKEQRWYERTPNGSHDYAVYDQPYPEHASCSSHVNDLAYYRVRFDLQPCWSRSNETME